MSFTVADVLLDVRELIQDTKAPYRYSDDFVIRKINRTLSRMVVLLGRTCSRRWQTSHVYPAGCNPPPRTRYG